MSHARIADARGKPRNRTARRGAPARTAILVLGMHRSGTSALTRTVGLLGCTLPKTLMKPSRNDNETGFWESEPIMRLNEAILTAAGSAWNDWRSLDRDWLETDARAGFLSRATALLRQEFGDAPLFALKDPRMCRLAPLWIEAIKAAGARPIALIPVRNPGEVAASLIRRNRMDPVYAQLFWLRHVLDAELISRDMPRVVTRYDQLLDDWEGVTARIAAAFGLDWTRPAAAAASEVDAFLSPGLRHHHMAQGETISEFGRAPWIQETYAILSRWADDDARPSDLAALDRIREAVDAAAPALDGALHDRDTEVSRLKGLLEEARGEATAFETSSRSEVAALGKRLAERDEEIVGLQRSRDEARGEAAALGRSRDEARSEVAALRAALDDERKRSERERAAERTLADQRTREIADLAGMLRESEGAAAALAATIRERETEISALQGDFVEAAAEVEDVRTQMQRLSATIRERETEISTLQGDFAKAAAEVEDVRAQMQRLSATTTRLLKAIRRTLGSAFHIDTKRRPQSVGRALDPAMRVFRRDAARLRACPLFDAKWYRGAYPDVAESGADPAAHFIAFGFAEGRAPSQLFRTAERITK